MRNRLGTSSTTSMSSSWSRTILPRWAILAIATLGTTVAAFVPSKHSTIGGKRSDSLSVTTTVSKYHKNKNNHFWTLHQSDAAASLDSEGYYQHPPTSTTTTTTTNNQTLLELMTLEQEEDEENNKKPSPPQPEALVIHGESTQHAVETTSPKGVPSYRELLLFTGTTMLIWLSEPLLSLVDTTVVGLTQGSSSVTQLASLGPATTLLDSLLYLTYFLAIATTNQIAASRATGNVRQLQRTTSQTMGVATVLGGLTTAVIWCWGRSWLTRMAGASATPMLVSSATAYAHIRAAAAIFAVVGMVAQSVCLATLDTRTPALAVAAASVLNVAGDLLLAPRWGVRGAAAATAASNVASTVILVRAVQKQMIQWRREEKELQTTDVTPTTAKNHDNNNNKTTKATSSSSSSSSSRVIPMISLPDRQSLLGLLKLVGPLFFVICAKIACYSAMTLRCTDFGVLPLAAHGIMMRLWFFFGCFGDSLSQTAQSYLPSTLYPKPRPVAFRKTLQRFLWIAGAIGVLNSQASNWILQYGGKLFTSDAAILKLMADHRQFIGASLLLHPFIMALEGTVMAARDFTTLVATYAVTLCLHFGILKWACPSFPAVWRTFFLFQSIRVVNFATHVWQKQRQAKKEEEALSVAAAAMAASS